MTREQKFRLEAFLIATSLLLVGVLAIFIGPKLKGKGDTYWIHFKDISVNGINEGSDVKYQGVKIGVISSIEVNTDDMSTILVYVEIKRGFPVKTGMRAKLQYTGITGFRFIEVYGGENSADTLEPGSEIPMGRGIGEKAEDIMINVDSVVGALNQVLNPENRQKIALTLDNIEKSTGVLARVLSKKEKNLGDFIDQLDKTGQELSQFSANLHRFSAYLNEVSGKIKLEKVAANADRMFRNVGDRFSQAELGETVKNLTQFVKVSSDSIRRIESTILDLRGNFHRALENLKESIDNISRFTRDLSEDPTVLLRKRIEKGGNKK